MPAVTCACSWLQELRPGLYSMHFPASESAPMTAELKYHPWQDPLLCSIKNFQRPQAFITPHTAPTTAAAPVAATTAAATAAAKASLSTDAAPVGAAAPLMDAQPDMEMYSSAQFDQAVELTLTALARAVAVRCLCIDQHSPHLHGDKASGKHSLGHGHSLSGKHSQHSHGHGQIHVHKSCTQGSGQFNTGALQTVASTFDTSSPQVSAGDHCSDGPRQCTSSTAQLSQLQTHASQAALALLSQPELSHTPHDRAQTNSEKATSSCKQPQSSRHRQQQSQPGHQETQCQLRPAPVLILFSGGVDSTLIAALAHQSLPVDVPIDLASVCFNEGRSADRLAAQDALLELMQFAPTREWRLIQVDSSLEEVDQHRNWLLGTPTSRQSNCHTVCMYLTNFLLSDMATVIQFECSLQLSCCQTWQTERCLVPLGPDVMCGDRCYWYHAYDNICHAALLTCIVIACAH